MKFKIASAALIVAAAGSAFAESPTIVKDDFVSTRTRAEVLAELHAYKQAGVNPWSMSYNPLRDFKSTTSRQQVVAEYLAGRDEVAAINGEDSGSAYFAQASAHRAPGGPILAGQPANAQ
jgi:uncharacterized protein DUF4148